MESHVLVVLGLYYCGSFAIIEPYPSVHGGRYLNNSYLSSYSSDPLINYVWDLDSVNSSQLQVYNITPKYAFTADEGSFVNLESIYLTPDDINVIVFGSGSITIDFGFENAAWFEMDSNDCNDNRLTMSISEYNRPGNTLDPNYPKTLQPVKYTNNGVSTYRLETNEALYDGVRYGFIHISNDTSTEPWHIIGIRLVSQIKPINYLGLFESNEYPILNYIWYAAAYCVKMNMLPRGMGSILMDRGDRIAFMGDSHIAFKVAMYAFGSFDYIKEDIIRIQNNTDNILSYPLYWVQSIYDYYLMTNDTTLLIQMQDKILFYLNESIAVFNTNPSINFYGWDERIGAGFEGANKSPEAQYAYKMLTIQTIGKSLLFFTPNALNNSGLHKYYDTKHIQFINTIRNDSDYLNRFGLHSSSDAINGLWMVQKETNYLFSKWFNDSVNICSWSPFNMFYIMNAIGILGRMDYVLSALDLCWGSQIRLGATTFWEEFSPEWNHWLSPNDPIPNAFGMTSECHPWSSGSLSILNEYVVGFKIIKPGFQHVKIAPALLQSRASIPVRNNKAIHIDFDGSIGRYIVNIPIEMEMDLYLPTTSLITTGNPVLYMNGRKYLDQIKIIKTTHQTYWMIHLRQTQLRIHKNHYFKIAVRSTDLPSHSKQIPNIFPPPYYPATLVQKDFETKGNWVNKYGKDGYILFAYQSKTNNVMKLPKWVTSIEAVGASVLNNWITTTTDTRALQNPNDPHQRALGAIYSNHTANQPPSFALNISIDRSMTRNASYYMSLYLCDWDHLNRKQTVHVFDALNLNIIAPIVYDDDYVNGVWLTFEVDRSVRIRINLVRGPTGVLSGIFFDLIVPERPKRPKLLK
eukprot:124179_1